MRGRPDLQTLVFYLITCPHANLAGLFRLTIGYIESDTGLPGDDVRRLLGELGDFGYCHYDPDAEVIWVVDHARHELGGKSGSSAASPQQKTAVARVLADFQCSPLAARFAEKYPEYLPDDFELDTLCHTLSNRVSNGYSIPTLSPSPSPSPSPLPAPSPSPKNKPLSGRHGGADPESSKEKAPGAVDSVWAYYASARQDYYRDKNGRSPPAPKLTKTARDLIKRRLGDGYTVDDCRAAIDGMFSTPHNRGENDRGKEFLGIEIALRVNRDGNNLERFRDYHLAAQSNGRPAYDPFNDPHSWVRHGIRLSSNGARRWCSRAGAWVDEADWTPRAEGEA